MLSVNVITGLYAPKSVLSHFFFLNRLMMNDPIFRSHPERVSGTPVFLDALCLACVRPNARFHEKLTPGILLFAIVFVF